MICSLAISVPRWTVMGLALALLSCAGHVHQPRAPYVPLAQLEAAYGRLITAGNHPTPGQNGTGDRLGLFLDTTGTLWGLPLTAAPGGAVLGCAPEALHKAKVTDTYPAGVAILGASNEPTGWR